MRNIKARFKKEEFKAPYHGACINLTKAVRGQKFSRQSLIKAFKKLMPDEEYEKSEMFQIIDFLEDVSNTLEENEKQGKNQFKDSLIQVNDSDVMGSITSENSLKI